MFDEVTPLFTSVLSSPSISAEISYSDSLFAYSLVVASSVDLHPANCRKQHLELVNQKGCTSTWVKNLVMLIFICIIFCIILGFLVYSLVDHIRSSQKWKEHEAKRVRKKPIRRISYPITMDHNPYAIDVLLVFSSQTKDTIHHTILVQMLFFHLFLFSTLCVSQPMRLEGIVPPDTLWHIKMMSPPLKGEMSIRGNTVDTMISSLRQVLFVSDCWELLYSFLKIYVIAILHEYAFPKIDTEPNAAFEQSFVFFASRGCHDSAALMHVNCFCVLRGIESDQFTYDITNGTFILNQPVCEGYDTNIEYPVVFDPLSFN